MGIQKSSELDTRQHPVIMSLLPRHHDEFRQKQYWDKFFTNREEKAFEWYGNFGDLKGILCRKCRQTDRILVIGCGNSDLSAELYQSGFQNIVNIDFSQLVIDEMKRKTADLTNMSWELMDMTKMTFPDNSFDIVLDKGAIYALMAQDTQEVHQEALRTMNEIQRVLNFVRDAGR